MNAMPDEITIPLTDWLRLNRENGYARGLLSGWLACKGEDQSRCAEATKAFLETKDA